MPRYSCRFASMASLLTIGTAAGIISGCSATRKATPIHTELAPGIPNRPELVAVIPFYWKPDQTEREKTKVVIPAEIDGKSGIFVLDLGSAPTMLNRTFLQPSASGGVDTVTEANRLPDRTPYTDYFNGNLGDYEKVRVRMRIGTLRVDFDDPELTHAAGDSTRRYNAMLGHAWGNFGWVFSPRLGNIGPAVLQPFETIIDYTRRRVVLIRLDSAGRRTIDVPAYKTRWTAPMVPIPIIHNIPGWGLAVGENNTLDTLHAENNTMVGLLDTGAPWSEGNVLGYDFLSGLGVFGINQRTRQFMLYH